jgi:hypothetical protein
MQGELSYTESGIRCALIGAAGEEAAALVDLSLVPAAARASGLKIWREDARVRPRAPRWRHARLTFSQLVGKHAGANVAVVGHCVPTLKCAIFVFCGGALPLHPLLFPCATAVSQSM